MAGLEQRYEIKKINDPEGKHDECRFFVLDPQHDPFALRTLSYYSALVEDAGQTELAADLREWTKSVRDGQAG